LGGFLDGFGELGIEGVFDLIRELFKDLISKVTKPTINMEIKMGNLDLS